MLVVLLCLQICLSQPLPPDPQTFWVDVPFDHNNPSLGTWKERVLAYDTFWLYNNRSGPIFFCAGGEADVRGGYDHNGFMFELGQKLGAFLLFPEHRFYGKSLPYGPTDSYKPQNVNKLTVEQAMADYIQVIKWAKAQWSIPSAVPLISFGGSYPGELTIFLRIAYPDIIDAGFASSAPVKYHQGMVPGGGFFKVCSEDFGRVNPQCPGLVRQAFSQIIEKSATPEGRKEVSTKLMLCDELKEGQAALRLLTLWIENAFAFLGMENYPYPLYGLPAFPAEYACRRMLQVPDLIGGLAQAVGVAYNTSNLKCFNITEEYYPCADITGCGGGVGDPDAMSWDYQSCTEIVSNVDTNNVTDPFPPAPYDFNALVNYCQQTWGVTPKPDYLPTKYNYRNTRRLILSNGAYDPWYPGGVLPDDCPEDKDIHCFLIDEAAHHLDLRGGVPGSDPVSVVNTRIVEKQIITGWIFQIAEEKKKAEMELLLKKIE